MPKTCPHCKCSELDVDPARGATVCMGCGTVLEENSIVSEVSFMENADGSSSMVGQFVSGEGANKPHFAGLRHGISKESRQMTLDRGKREIREMASSLHLNQHCIDTAFNFFKMAINKRLSRGRRIQHIVAACLYMTCRIVGTPHMLLDFSDITQVNVFTLGKAFLVLAKELHIHLPVLDPCMYITRFAHRMDFGDKTNEVGVAAMRLVSRMKRDWIHTGRRPSGLCGAALLVAARLHGYSCTLKDVVRVVRIGHDTIRKRLSEFVSTPSSQLTINEFMNIDLESEADPPAFTESRLKQKQANLENFEEEIDQLSNAIDNEIENSLPKRLRTDTVPTPPSKTYESPLATQYPIEDPELQVAADFVHAENPEAVAKKLLITSKGTTQNPLSTQTASAATPGPAPSLSSLGLTQPAEDCFKVPTLPWDKNQEEEEEQGELDLSNINDEEIDQMILSPNETIIKTRLWMAENGEYMQEMAIRAEKRRREEEEREKTRPKKPKRKLVSKKDYYANSQSAGEAIEKLLQRQKLSSKINYDALKRVNEEPSPQPVRTGPKFIDSFANLAKYDLTPKIEKLFEDEPQVVKIEETKPIVPRKKMKVAPCLNPDAQDDLVKPEIITESGPVSAAYEVTVESGPVAVEEEGYEEYDDDEHCLSASQLMQEAGVGDSGYGGFNYEGYDEYD
uniref:transcription factor IIIB 90 kDa subunit-like n=1 Tax=Styela clava TaxID=7725 RepID=UPI001939B020|nr:transcription factor IIIB 90 kDa subunit-like [Styela clava]